MSILERSELFRSASSIAFYNALEGEVETLRFMDKWFGKKRFFLPSVVGQDLRFLLYEGPDSLVEGPFGIWEPRKDCPEILVRELDLIIVPGVAFDKEKNRLGRGKGFYDRLLSSLSVPKIGICFGFQLFPRIPVEPLDKKMDYIITEEGMF